MSKGLKPYEVHLYEDTLYVRQFMARSEEHAIELATALYEKTWTNEFESYGTELQKIEAELLYV